eukprot:92401-Alexandrium_andersonii.AAC.1
MEEVHRAVCSSEAFKNPTIEGVESYDRSPRAFGSHCVPPCHNMPPFGLGLSCFSSARLGGAASVER